MKKFLLILTSSTLLLSCDPADSKTDLPEITSTADQSSGFVDLVVSITDKKENDTAFVYTAKGLYKNDTVGIKVSLKKGLKAGVVNGDMKNVFVTNGISIASLGKQSDKLLSAMTELYKVDSINAKMKKDPMVFSCANLNENDIDYTSGEYRFKIFMETEDDMGELFVNFNFTLNRIYLNEKDQEYRRAVLRYWMEK